MKNLKTPKARILAMCLGLATASFSSFAQSAGVCATPAGGNLVCNSSFEYWDTNQASCQEIAAVAHYTDSAYANNSLFLCNRWYSGTHNPDYLMRCNSNDSIFSYCGPLVPKTGNACTSITTYHDQLPYWVEYVAQNLPAKLISGKKYYASFYANLTTNANFYTKNLGMAVVPLSTTPSINVTPKIIRTGHLFNRTTWDLIGGTFTADGTEQKILIGRFGEASQISAPTPTGYYSNYNIDDVSLILLPQNLPANWTVSCGTSITLGINEYTNFPANMSVVWKENGIIIPNKHELALVVSPSETKVYTRTVIIDGQAVDSASCTLTVNAAPHQAIISQTAAFLSANIVSDASYQWLKSGQDIPNATQPNYTPTTSGVYSVRITVDSCYKVSNVINMQITGIANKLNASVNVYPNPSNGAFTLSTKEIQNATVRIIDVQGKEVLSQKLVKSETNFELPRGLYIVQVSNNEGVATKRLAIK